MRIGLGVSTYDRVDQLRETLDAIRRFTRAPHELIVADDGSEDGTVAALEREGVPYVTGANRGVAWNKNRLLFHLHEIRGCDVVITLEDDTVPTAPGWEEPWIEAARRYGHANYAGEWFRELFQGGQGTPDDPYRCVNVSAQCACFSREALNVVGYMDTRFRRYGYEHGEHSLRLLRAGYGGIASPQTFYLLKSDLSVRVTPSKGSSDDLDAASGIFGEVIQDPTLHRRAWRSYEEEETLRAEMAAARNVPRRAEA